MGPSKECTTTYTDIRSTHDKVSTMKGIKRPGPLIISILLAVFLLGYNVPILLLEACTLSEVFELAGILCVTTLLIYLISVSSIVVRILTIILLLLNSVFLYFILFYKIKIYPPVIAAILQTDSRETLELISVSLVAWVAIFGFIPAYLTVKLTKNINSDKRARLITLCVIMVLIAVYKFNVLNARSYTAPKLQSFKKAHPYAHPSYLWNKYLPYSYIYHTRLYAARALRFVTDKKHDLTSVHSFSLQDNSDVGTYFVLVVGESARSDRFALNGYKHETNTRLARVPNLVSFSDCHSLDTSTLKAVPHIFMHERRSKEGITTKETSLIHILKHVGFKTLWLSCNRGQYQSIIHDIALESDMTVYASGLWHYNTNNKDILQYDHALLQPLQEAIKENHGGLIVLHTKGSHIDYRSRVPREIYSVTHKSNVSLDKGNSLNSSYDSTIKYTDLFLSDVITLLKNKKAMLLYIPDHGESLGEGGVYAHNAPLETAPKYQTHIPMIWWASNKFLSNPVNAARFANIRANASKYVDQSYVFHSVLNCLGIQSSCINKNKSVCEKWS